MKFKYHNIKDGINYQTCGLKKDLDMSLLFWF